MIWWVRVVEKTWLKNILSIKLAGFGVLNWNPCIIQTKIVLLAISYWKKIIKHLWRNKGNNKGDSVAIKNVLWASSIVSQSQIHKGYLGSDWMVGRDLEEAKKGMPVKWTSLHRLNTALLWSSSSFKGPWCFFLSNSLYNFGAQRPNYYPLSQLCLYIQWHHT